MKILLLFLLGASLGSFLGLVIDRFPHQSLLFPASHCNHCKKPLKAWDLIPIFSQIRQKSRCAYCHAKIPLWYALLELLTGVLVLMVECKVISAAEFILLLCGLVLAIYDIKHKQYPLVVWLVFALIILIFSNFNFYFLILIGFALLAEIFPLKIGSGDFLYLALIALVFSLTDLLWIIQLSSYLGISFIVCFKHSTKYIPFVPFLLLGLLLYLPFASMVF